MNIGIVIVLVLVAYTCGVVTGLEVTVKDIKDHHDGENNFVFLNNEFQWGECFIDGEGNRRILPDQPPEGFEDMTPDQYVLIHSSTPDDLDEEPM